MKATSIANSNTALIKYWGKKDEQLIIPMNNSISMTTDALTTTTTVQFSDSFKEDLFILNDKEQSGKPYERVTQHLTLIRKLTKNELFAKVVSMNNFPTAAGLASSASGFAALTHAACLALGLDYSLKELSMISRQGSGSSCRSFFGGYVEWIASDKNNQSYAIQLQDEHWMEIFDIVVVLNAPERKISTREAMKISMKTSPFYKSRLEATKNNLKNIRKAIDDKDFTKIGEITEQDCLSMHSVAMTTNPAQIFWTADTLRVIKLVEELRENKIDVYYTIDTGANMHLLTLPEFKDEVTKILKEQIKPKGVILSKTGSGVKESTKHLF